MVLVSLQWLRLQQLVLWRLKVDWLLQVVSWMADAILVGPVELALLIWLEEELWHLLLLLMAAAAANQLVLEMLWMLLRPD